MRGKRVGLLSNVDILKATTPASINGAISAVVWSGMMVP
jgi:hypothetical protein